MLLAWSRFSANFTHNCSILGPIENPVNLWRTQKSAQIFLLGLSYLLGIGALATTTATATRTSKKRNCSYLSKTTTFYAHHTFLYISLSSLQDYDLKVLNLNLLIFVSFPKLGCVPQEINSWKILLHLTFSANWNKCKKF